MTLFLFFAVLFLTGSVMELQNTVEELQKEMSKRRPEKPLEGFKVTYNTSPK